MQVGAGIAGVVGSLMAFRQSLAPALEQTGALGEISPWASPRTPWTS